MAKDQPYPTGDVIELPIPFAIAAEYFAKAIGVPLKDRAVVQLAFGDVDLGSWQIVSVRQHVHSAGYNQAMAKLRKVYSNGD